MIPAGCLGSCQIIHDPDRLAGFPAGARLNGVVPMLKGGVFTMGTTLQFQGRRWRVVGAVGQAQWLEWVR